MNQQQATEFADSPDSIEFEKLLQKEFDVTKPGELVDGNVVEPVS